MIPYKILIHVLKYYRALTFWFKTGEQILQQTAFVTGFLIKSTYSDLFTIYWVESRIIFSITYAPTKQLSLMAGSTELLAGQHFEQQNLVDPNWWSVRTSDSEGRDPRKPWISLVLGPTCSGLWVPAPQNDKRILPQKWLQKNSKTHKSVPLHGIL